jgi:hypothetical protein
LRPEGCRNYGAEKNTVSINGGIVEKNLETFNRYGSGDNPAQWIDLLAGNTSTNLNSSLEGRKNDGIPDGLYLSLCKDKAGLTGEAKVKITIDNVSNDLITSPDGNYISAADIRGRHPIQILKNIP